MQAILTDRRAANYIHRETELQKESVTHNEIRPQIFIKDPGSAITHFIGVIYSVAMAPFLLAHALEKGANGMQFFSFLVFSVSMFLLYAASTTYHTLNLDVTTNKKLKRMDHMMIFVLIAGSYTPICTTVLWNGIGRLLLLLVWGMAIAGMIVKYFWINCPKWFSSVIYIGMGWLCIVALPQILKGMTLPGFLWLLAGGLFYTFGGVLYALKLKALNERFPNFGSHEIFHLFVMAGNLCHFYAIYTYLL